MTFMQSVSDLFGGILKAAGYGFVIYFVLQWTQRQQSGQRGSPPVLETQAASSQQAVQAQRNKKDKRAKAAGKGLGGGVGAAEAASPEPIEDDEPKAQPNQVRAATAASGIEMLRIPRRCDPASARLAPTRPCGLACPAGQPPSTSTAATQRPLSPPPLTPPTPTPPHPTEARPQGHGVDLCQRAALPGGLG